MTDFDPLAYYFYGFRLGPPDERSYDIEEMREARLKEWLNTSLSQPFPEEDTE